MIGRTVSHYKILEKLGGGGMGVVYKAHDTKLKRTVALKFLSPQALGSEEDKTRFIHEAQAAAALNHNNICTIHEIDEFEGQPFIAMEFIDGASLSARIEEGPLELADAVDIAIQVAEGLREAHEHGIVHRDVKPSNVMLSTRGQVKITDFGLAKFPGREQLTQVGTTVGTIAYMSPESGRGESADGRGDLWSLGVILYEMVAGRRPFTGQHEQAVMYSVLNEEATPLTGVRTAVPVELERVVNKCLAKDPAQRYQHADDLLVDLRRLAGGLQSETRVVSGGGSVGRRRWVLGSVVVAIAAVVFVVVYARFWGTGTGEPEAGVKKLAVLFFENLGASDDEYFANGITDAITARLGVMHGLGVISRQSTIQYKGSAKSIQEIGKELGVDYILEGTIQRERPGDPTSRVRIIPQLIDVADDIHVWADTYDEDMTEVFRVQSSISERVASALSVTLLDTEREALASAPTNNLKAYEYFLRGNEYSSRRYSKENVAAAIESYERAVELDPGFAEAWAKLSIVYMWDFNWGIGALPERRTEARAAVDRAQALDPDAPEAQVALGYLYYYGEHDLDRALEHFETARRSLPNDVGVVSAIAFIKRRQGNWEECAELLERAVELNPRYATMSMELGITYTAMRQYDKGRRCMERVIFLDPGQSLAYVFEILQYLLADGDTAMARETLVDASEAVGPAELGIGNQGFALARIMPDTYAELLSRSPQEGSTVDDTSSYHLGLAEMYHVLGRENEARRLWSEEQVRLESARNPVFQEDIDLYLALTHASLGSREEAARIVNEMPASSLLSTDALFGAFRVNVAALIYVRLGEYERAIDQLEALLSVPSEMSPALLRIDPAWDPLRDNPRFQKLVEKTLQ
jgi:TolB-like protein/tRNA A-37 threonylcarbamoyl transferase component Bud32/Flp pilus assembly protein TadD